MIIVDAHCDTVTKIMEEKKGENLFKNTCHFDLTRAKTLGSFVQFFAAFIDPIHSQAYALRRAIQIIDKLEQQAEEYSDSLMLCNSFADIEKAFSQDKVAGIKSIEGGEALQGDLGVLRAFYKLGVRSICLTWNHRNEIADGVADASSGGGLTPFGKAVVSEMNRLGMLVDVSHLSEKGFWDVIETSKQPIIASHSNSKAICNHRRNLTDEQVSAIKGNGGVIGINLYPDFLNNSDKASIKDVIKHIEHISSIGGDGILGIGADFDGIEVTPVDIQGVQDINALINELLKLNYSEAFVKGFSGENFMRVIKQVIG